MRQRHHAVGFVVRLVVLYALLIIPWPGVTDGYARGFHLIGNLVFQNHWEDSRVSFEPPPVFHAAWDTEIHVRRLDTGVGWHTELSSRHWGFVPTAAVLALIGAIAIPWRRLFGALLAGLLLTYAFILFRVWVVILYSIEWSQARTARNVRQSVLKFLCDSLSASPIESFVVPVFIWLILMPLCGIPAPWSPAAPATDIGPPARSKSRVGAHTGRPRGSQEFLAKLAAPPRPPHATATRRPTQEK